MIDTEIFRHLAFLADDPPGNDPPEDPPADPPPDE